MGINSRAQLEGRVVENGWVKSRGGDVTMKLVDDTDTLKDDPPLQGPCVKSSHLCLESGPRRVG